MTREEAIAHLTECKQYLRYSILWRHADELETQVLVLDGRYTADELEAFALIMRHEPTLFNMKDSTK